MMDGRSFTKWLTVLRGPFSDGDRFERVAIR